MKFRITMKDPDGVYDSLDDAATDAMNGENFPADEYETLRDMRRDKFKALCDKWFEYNEYLTVEINTEAETCVVVPRK